MKIALEQVLIHISKVSYLRLVSCLHIGTCFKSVTSQLYCDFNPILSLLSSQITIILPCSQDFKHRFSNENGGYAPLRPRQHQAGGEVLTVHTGAHHVFTKHGVCFWCYVLIFDLVGLGP